MNKKYVDMTPKQAQELIDSINSSNLDDNSREVATSSIDLVLWLQNELRESKLSIKRLRHLFGIKTEKKSLQLTKLQQALMMIQD